MELLGDMGNVESRLIRFEMVLVLVEDRCTVCAKCTIGSYIVWTHPMVLQGDEAHFGPFGDRANLDARSVHGLRRTYHRL